MPQKKIQLDAISTNIEIISIVMDKLSPLFSRFALSARVFYSGSLCGISDFEAQPGIGHLHLLRQGSVHVTHSVNMTTEVSQPSVIFYPRPYQHRLQVSHKDGAELVCAEIQFGAGMGNPLLHALPDVVVIPLSGMEELKSVLNLLFDEAFARHYGRQAALDRLMEYFLILLLRHAMTTRLIEGGVFSGLADMRLAKALNAIHEKPEHQWTLEKLAHVAGMSRARFAVNFRETVGTTPLDYLTAWRIAVAQTLLKRGTSLKMVAPAVGYSSALVLARIFRKRTGTSPSAWLTNKRK